MMDMLVLILDWIIVNGNCLKDLVLISFLVCHNPQDCENTQFILGIGVFISEGLLLFLPWLVNFEINMAVFIGYYLMYVCIFDDIFFIVSRLKVVSCGCIVLCVLIVVFNNNITLFNFQLSSLIVVVSAGYFVQRFCIVLVTMFFVMCSMFHLFSDGCP